MRINKIPYYLLLGFFKAVALLPYGLLYATLSPLIYLIIYKLGGYRVAVVRKNLLNSFPEKSEAERREIERKFYHHLADLFVDNIKIASLSEKEAQKRFVMENSEDLPSSDLIFATGHYGSWELSSYYAKRLNQRTLAIYRPLHNKAFDQYYTYARSRFGSTLVPMNNILREVITHRKQHDALPLSIIMIADQTPSRHEQDHWYNFLNQETSFFGGPEKMGAKFKMAIYFVNISRPKRGHYTCRFEQIYDGVEALEAGEVTRRYVEKLEAMIRRQPEIWLWSHRRWKHKRTK